MKLMKVAVIGAGAIGSYFIDGLCEKLGENLWVIAEGERKERLRNSGILINGERRDLNVRSADEAVGADLVIVSVKYGALREIIPSLETIVQEHTLILSPLNGIDSEQIIGDAIGHEHVMKSFMKIASQRVGDQITYDPAVTQGLFYGEPGGVESERVRALKDLFEGSKVNYVVSDDIERDMWLKYALNIRMNLPQAIINCGIGAYRDSEHMAYISERMRAEVEAVAAAKGIDISDYGSAASQTRDARPDNRFSTLQDLDAGRPTEIDMFSGTLVKMGKELGVDTSFNEFAYHAIKSLEEKNAGIIK